MTASASNSKTLSANYGSYSLSVSWSESSPTIATNKSKITASATLSSGNTAFDSGSDADAYQSHISVYWFDNNKYENGVKIDGTDFRSCGISPYGSRSASGEIWVEHKDDGTLKGYCVTYFTNNNGGPYAPASNSCSTSEKSLDTIARASSPTVTPNPQTWSNTSSNTITVTTNRKSSGFTHTVRVDLWGYQETKTGVGASTTFAIPYSTLASMPYYKTFTGSVYTQTKNGSENVGGEVRTPWTINIDTSIEHPTVESITLEDTNAKSAAVEAQGSFIANASNLRATIALGVAGSYTELNEATVVCGNVSQTYVLGGTSQTIVFEQEGLTADNLKVIVTDARGTTITETRTWNLIPYVSLTALGQVRRTSEIGDEVAIGVTGRCFAGNFRQASNVITVKMKSKLHTASDYPITWTTLGTVTPSGDGETTFTFQTTRTGYDYDQQYDFLFYVEDLFTSAESSEVIVTTGIPVYGNGADFFAVYGDSYLHWDRTDPSKFWNINDALNGILAHDGVKNMLQLWEGTKTVAGITYTPNKTSGSITANGTSTGYSEYVIAKFKTYSGNRYILSGCPEGGGSRTFFIGINGIGADYGDGLTFDGDGSVVSVAIGVFQAQTVNNIVFRPMIRDAKIASDSFVRYAVTTKPFYMEWNKSYGAQNVDRTDDVFTIHGSGIVWVSVTFLQTSTGNYGTIFCGVDFQWNGIAQWYTFAEEAQRMISQGSGQQGLGVNAHTNVLANEGDKFRIFYRDSNSGATKILRCQIVCLGCYVTKD